MVLDRVRDRLDAASSGHNWRTTKPDFSTVLFSGEDLKEQLIKWPPKNPAAVISAAAAEAEKAKAKSQAATGDTPPPPNILVSSTDSGGKESFFLLYIY